MTDPDAELLARVAAEFVLGESVNCAVGQRAVRVRPCGAQYSIHVRRWWRWQGLEEWATDDGVRWRWRPLLFDTPAEAHAFIAGRRAYETARRRHHPGVDGTQEFPASDATRDRQPAFCRPSAFLKGRKR